MSASAKKTITPKSAAQQLASMSPEVRNMYLLAAAKKQQQKREQQQQKSKEKRSASSPSIVFSSSSPEKSKISHSVPSAFSEAPSSPMPTSPLVERKRNMSSSTGGHKIVTEISPSSSPSSSSSSPSPPSVPVILRVSSPVKATTPKKDRRKSHVEMGSSVGGYDQALPFLSGSKLLTQHLEKEMKFQKALHQKASSKLHNRKRRTERMRSKRSTLNDLPISHIKSLTSLLVKNDFLVARSLVTVVHANESSKELCDALVRLLMPSGKALKLVVSALKQEVESCEKTSTTTLLRSDSTATNLTSSFNRYFCKAFLRHCLQNTAKRVMSMGSSSLEFKPSPKVDESDVQHNIEDMCRICEKLINRIVDSSSECPPETKKLLQVALSVVESQEGFKSQGMKVVSSLLFLRLICPALVTPNLYGIVSASPSMAQTKAFTMLSKVIQNLINDVPFDSEKEPHMTVFNALFTPERTSKIVHFVDGILDHDTSNVEKSLAALSLGRVEKIDLLQLIAKYVLVYASKLSTFIPDQSPLRNQFEEFLPEDIRNRVLADSSSATETDESLQSATNSNDSEESSTDFSSCDELWSDITDDSDLLSIISDSFGEEI